MRKVVLLLVVAALMALMVATATAGSAVADAKAKGLEVARKNACANADPFFCPN